MKDDGELTTAQRACVEACRRSAKACMQTAIAPFPGSGETPFDASQFRLAVSCAELCRLTATFVRRQIPEVAPVCRACAEVCDACAEFCDTCERLRDCAKACRECAAACRLVVLTMERDAAR